MPAATLTIAPRGEDAHLDRLRDIFAGMKSVLVCFSGGVDSAFVLAVAHEVLGTRAVGMTAVSPSLAPEEKALAIRVAEQIGARHELVESHEIDDESYLANNPDRCFHCKSELYRLSAAKQAEWSIEYVVNGTNLDDLGDYRPGLEAARSSKPSFTRRTSGGPRPSLVSASGTNRQRPASRAVSLTGHA
jgi:uncharacterized protein